MKNFINKYIISILIFTFTLLIIEYYQSSRYLPQQTITFRGKIIPLNYTNSTLLNNFNKKNIDEYQTAAGTYDIQTIASEITSTMLNAFNNSTSKTLPLVANWNIGIPEYSNGLDPLYLINRFTYGEHLIPTWKLDPYFNNSIGLDYYETSIKKAAELGLPLVFILPSPESALTQDDIYFSMDKIENPNVITAQGTVLPKLSPFGPDNLWNEVGEQWSSTSLMAQLQEWYPNPPLVVFMDEDSSKKLSWSELPTSSRYISQYPTNTSNEFKRTLVNAKWLEKYRQLHEGFKQGFTKNAWKQNTKFVTRNQLASNMGVTADWINSATTTNQYANIWPLTADGLTINFHLDQDKTDIVNAPHTLLNNLPFMLEEAKELNPNFIYQLSIDANQKIDNPQRYRGFTQFALWFLRPGIIRQTANKTTREEINPLFQQVVDSIEFIYNSDVLSNFWKNGRLVSTGTSMYNQNIPTNYKSVPREFLLKTDATSTVWAFALAKGVTPNKEWLIYIQSPEKNLTNITVTVPDFGNINLDTTQKGNFYLITKSNGSINNIEQTNIISSDINNKFNEINISVILKLFSTNTILKNHPLESGNTYYFDSINGDDTNDGLSEKTAWKTLDKLNQTTFQPNDNILFRKGQVFNGKITYIKTSTTNQSSILLSAYGIGTKPIISSLKNESFTFNQFENNIWRTKPKNFIYSNRLQQDNKEIAEAETYSDLNNMYRWHYDKTNNDLYIYSNTDPSNSQFLVSTAQSTIVLYKNSHIILDQLDIRGGLKSMLIVNSNNISITNCLIGNMSQQGLSIVSTTPEYTSHHFSIQNNIFDSHYKPNVLIARSAKEGLYIGNNAYNFKIDHNQFINWGHSSIDIFPGEETNFISDINISNNILTAPDLPYGGRIATNMNSNKINIYNNIIYNNGAPSQIGGFNNYFHHNIIFNSRNDPQHPNDTGKGISIASYSGPVYNNIFENNTIVNSDGPGLYISAGYGKGDIYNNIFRNNIFYNVGLQNKISETGEAIRISNSNEIHNNIYKNNVFYNKKTKMYISYKNTKLTLQEFNHLINENNLEENILPNKRLNPIYDVKSVDLNNSKNTIDILNQNITSIKNKHTVGAISNYINE